MAKDNWRTKKKAAKKVAKKTPARKKAAKKVAKKAPAKKKVAKKAPAKKKAAKKVAKKTPAKKKAAKKAAKKAPARKKAAKKAPAKKKALTHAERENSYIASLSTHERILRKAIQSIEEDNWLNDPDVKLLGLVHGDEPSMFDDRKLKRLRRYLNFKRIYLSIQIQALRAIYDNDENEEKMLEELDFNNAMSPYRHPNPYEGKDKVIDRFLAPIDSWFNCNRPGKIYDSFE